MPNENNTTTPVQQHSQDTKRLYTEANKLLF